MNKKYITISKNLIREARLGSQMFNYLTLYSIAKKTGHEVALVPAFEASPFDFQYSDLVSNCFDKPFSLFPQNEPYDVYNSKFCHTNVIEEELLNLDSTKNFIVNARFDCGYIYFKDYLHEFPFLFKFQQTVLEQAQKIIQNIKQSITTVHFRRGDYGFYMDTFINYYEQAFNKIPNDSFLLLLSEDKDWINNSIELKNLVKDKNVIRPNSNEFVDLCLMTMSDYNICCPSSFSLLGSVLNPKPHTTIYPLLNNTAAFQHIQHIQSYVEQTHKDWVLITV